MNDPPGFLWFQEQGSIYEKTSFWAAPSAGVDAGAVRLHRCSRADCGAALSGGAGKIRSLYSGPLRPLGAGGRRRQLPPCAERWLCPHRGGCSRRRADPHGVRLHAHAAVGALCLCRRGDRPAEQHPPVLPRQRRAAAVRRGRGRLGGSSGHAQSSALEHRAGWDPVHPQRLHIDQLEHRTGRQRDRRRPREPHRTEKPSLCPVGRVERRRRVYMGAVG